jgi:tRNA (guanine37-N1)-methyltransferase
VATSARAGDMPVSRARAWLEDRPVLLVMGTGYGLAPKVIEQADGLLRGIRFLDSYNHLSVRSATSILVDRLLGDVL